MKTFPLAENNSGLGTMLHTNTNTFPGPPGKLAGLLGKDQASKAKVNSELCSRE